ncbi:MAG: SpoIID/LytB protein [Marmoricola sp.]|nr:SpoIID/LytB protein [Marmoricola sp.]
MRLRPALCVTLLACASLLAPVLPAQAATSDAAVQVGSSFVLAGHGNGHGHGLSQYGARGAAIKGLPASQILAFYYPGTKLAKDTRSVKVLITADDDGSASVMPAQGLYVVDLTSSKKYTLPAGTQKAWRLRVVSGKTRVEYLNNGWHAYKPGGLTTLVGSGQFRTPSGVLTLRAPDGHVRYRGGIRLVGTAVINVLSLDNYVKGVVPREMPALWEAAALQSQAVAARTYAAYEIGSHDHYDLCDTSACQVYGGLDDEATGSTRAVVATAQKVLTYGGKPAFAQFSASNGGYTSQGGAGKPYLPGKKDPYDLTASNPYKNWHQTITAKTVQGAFPAIGTLRTVQVLDHDSTGRRVASIRLTGSRTSTTITGDRMRTIFGLRSTYFHVTKP